MKKWPLIQPAVAKAVHEAADQTLAGLARELGQSPFHAHGTLSKALGETPKDFTLRLRLDRAAGLPVTTPDTILDIALVCGFESHEVFLRAFRRRFGLTPSAYRKRGVTGNAAAHAALVNEIGPCLGLLQLDAREVMNVNYDIEVATLPAQPVLLVRRRVPAGGDRHDHWPSAAVSLSPGAGQRHRHLRPSLDPLCKWLTVTSPEGPDELELSLEPTANPDGRAFQEAMFAQKIPVAAFETADIDADYRRLSAQGVVFLSAPQAAGPVKIAVFSDVCGNLIQLSQAVQGAGGARPPYCPGGMRAVCREVSFHSLPIFTHTIIMSSGMAPGVPGLLVTRAW